MGARGDTTSARRAGRAVTDRPSAAPPRLDSGTLPPGGPDAFLTRPSRTHAMLPPAELLAETP
jgi:hypothetical protein